MTTRTTPRQRRECYKHHLDGETYQAIADREGVSKWTVRYWYRRQRDGGGCETRYRREPTEFLGHLDPKVRYYILRLRSNTPAGDPTAF